MTRHRRSLRTAIWGAFLGGFILGLFVMIAAIVFFGVVLA